MTGQIESVPKMDLDPADKAVLQERLSNKLIAYRRASAAQIEGIRGIVSTSGAESKDLYLRLMLEIQDRIAPGSVPTQPSADRR